MAGGPTQYEALVEKLADAEYVKSVAFAASRTNLLRAEAAEARVAALTEALEMIEKRYVGEVSRFARAALDAADRPEGTR